MKTKEEREQQFRKDFKELLEVYGAEMELTYGEFGYSSTAAINISIPATYDPDGNVSEEFCEFDLDS